MGAVAASACGTPATVPFMRGKVLPPDAAAPVLLVALSLASVGAAAETCLTVPRLKV